ncbi:hypothetical protein GOODEAATRI_000307 [Goodea atripinnis]|uniref:Uncharacterized protein n=1 Tax=Goodea atripinnis TaxID=208336 RepID=A0ABV0N6R3_9TELE
MNHIHVNKMLINSKILEKHSLLTPEHRPTKSNKLTPNSRATFQTPPSLSSVSDDINTFTSELPSVLDCLRALSNSSGGKACVSQVQWPRISSQSPAGRSYTLTHSLGHLQALSAGCRPWSRARPPRSLVSGLGQEGRTSGTFRDARRHSEPPTNRRSTTQTGIQEES